MTIPNVPLDSFPKIDRPLSNITPFTYRDGLTYLEVLEELRSYVKNRLVADLDGKVSELVAAWNNDFAAFQDIVVTELSEKFAELDLDFNSLRDLLTDQVEQSLKQMENGLEAYIDYIDEQVALWLNSQIEANDSIVSTILKDENSESFKEVEQTVINALTADGTELSSNLFDVTEEAANASPSIEQAIVTATNLGKTLVIQPGTYTCTSPIAIPEGANVKMDGVTLDFTGLAGSFYAMTFWGSVSPNFSMVTEADKGEKFFTLSTPNVFSPGDWIKLTSTDVFDAASTGTELGEIVRVESVNGNTVYVDTPLSDTYTTNIRAHLITMKSGMSLTGGKIIGPNNPEHSATGIMVTWAENVRITGVTFDGFDSRSIGLHNSVNCIVDQCTFTNAHHAFMGYGVVFANATRDSKCTNSHFNKIRHALSTNNTITGVESGIVRRIQFAFNTVENSARSLSTGGGGDAIDTHTAAEDIDILYNTVNGSTGAGINVQCPTAKIVGNTINVTGTDGITYNNQSDRDGDVVITDNVVRNSGEGWWGIKFLTGYLGGLGRTRSAVVSNNILRNVDRGIRVGKAIGGQANALRDSGISVMGNSVYEAKGLGILAQMVDNLTVIGNTLWNTLGLEVDRSQFSVISGNVSRLPVDGVAHAVMTLKSVTRSRVEPGAIRASSTVQQVYAMSFDASCANVSVGKTNHLFATAGEVEGLSETVIQD